MSSLQRFVLGTGAVLVALRLFLPVQFESRYGPTTDLRTTLLHAAGIVVIAAAMFVLAPSLNVRGFWVGLRRVVVVLVLAALLGVSGFLGFKHWQNSLEQSRYRVIEGRSLGNIALGMSLADVQRRLGPFTSAMREPTNVTRYDWFGTDGYWEVVFDGAMRAVSIMNDPAGTVVLPPRYVLDPESAWKVREGAKFVTTRGARYNHDSYTIRALYGAQPKTYRFYVAMTDYYPDIRTEFVFAPISNKNMNLPSWATPIMVLARIRIYAEGWSPERVWGPDYGQEKKK